MLNNLSIVLNSGNINKHYGNGIEIWYKSIFTVKLDVSATASSLIALANKHAVDVKLFGMVAVSL